MRKYFFFLLFSLFSFGATAAVVSVTIPSGDSLSGAVDLTPYIHSGQPKSIAILMPDAWTTANLTFLISADGGSTFTQLFDGNGNEYVVNADASRYILLDPAVFGYAGVFQIQSSDTSALPDPSTPVDQGASRVLKIIAQPIN